MPDRPHSAPANLDAGALDDVALSIIIANYNGRKLLEDCLASVYQYPPSRSFEIIVVDDASRDGSDAVVRERFPEVRLLRNDVNVHYGRSNNRALDIARGGYVYLLNNDTLMLPGSLDAMVAFLDEHPDAGAVGSKLLNEDGTIQWSVKTLPNVMSALFGARSIVTRLFPGNPFSRNHLLHLRHDMSRPFTAGYVSSASIMLRREVVRQVGHLDERLSYHVDADYCKRVWDAGWLVYYLPQATVVHLNHRGGTMLDWRRRLKSVVEFHRGSYIYFVKHKMKSAWHPMHFLTVVGLALRFAVSLICQAVEEVAVHRSGSRRGRGV